MSESDVWTSPSDSTPPPDELPSGSELLSKTVNKVTSDFGTFLIGGLAPGLVTVIGIIPAIILLYGGMGLGMAPGLMAEDETLTLAGMMAGLTIGTAAMIGGFTLALAPMQASLYRAVWAYLEKDEKMTIGSAFSTFGQDLGRVVVYQFVMIALVFTGALFCYAPGLLVAAALSFAGPAIYIHRLGIAEAISLSVRHLQAHPGWHLIFFLWSALITFVLQYIPLIGSMLLFTVHPYFVLMAYRSVFGTGVLPRGFGANA